MRERPLVYLVPPMAAALYAAVCLELPVQLHIIAPIALLLVACGCISAAAASVC